MESQWRKRGMTHRGRGTVYKKKKDPSIPQQIMNVILLAA
jgi:hypothetical protein